MRENMNETIRMYNRYRDRFNGYAGEPEQVDFVKRICNIDTLEIEFYEDEMTWWCDNVDDVDTSEWTLEQHTVWRAWVWALKMPQNNDWFSAEVADAAVDNLEWLLNRCLAEAEQEDCIASAV